MTTIVYKNGIMAADTREVSGQTARRCTKLFKFGRTIIGTAGDSFAGMVFVDWWGRGRPENDRPDLTNLDMDEDFECLVWHDAKLYVVNRLMLLVEVSLEDYPFYAIGSGSDVALGALSMGASAKRAIEIAADFDVNTGLPVETRACKANKDEDRDDE